MRKSAPRIVVSLLAVTMLFSGCGNNSEAQESEIRKPYMDKYHVVHSSDSTGKPGYFVYDDDAWGQMLLANIRAALWNMTMPQILLLLMKGPALYT